MIAQYGKRALSLFLAVVMIFSAVPVQVFAEENHDHLEEPIVVDSEVIEVSEEVSAAVSEESVEEPFEVVEEEPSEVIEEVEEIEEEIVESGESEALIALRAEIAAYIETYGLTADMPDSVLAKVYFELDGEQAYAAWFGVEAFVEQGMELPLEERKQLLEEQNSKLVKRFYEVMQSINNPVPLADNTFAPVSGVAVQVSGTTKSVTESNGAITITMEGTTNCGVAGYNSANVILTNDSGKKAIITFSWQNTSCVDADGFLSANPFSATMEAGAQLSFELRSPNGSGKTGTLVLSDFTCETVQGNVDITFEYDDARGSVSVDGNAVENGATVSVATAGAALEAVSSGSYKFVAWVDSDNKVLSREATIASFAPDRAMTLKAVFAGTDPIFLVDDTYVVEGLEEALAKGSRVVLMNNATLPEGNYTIPSGVTLLIPFDDANTLYTSEPGYVDSDNANPTFYRTLTMQSGANIDVYGAISLSAKCSYKQQHNGRPVIALSRINMEENSAITVKDKGTLYAWGYITGEGSVVAENGAMVYENFQVRDWRGGSAILGNIVGGGGMLDNEHGVFPISQYYVQNIEVPLTIYAGASEKAFTAVSVQRMEMGSSIPFIGSSGSMFAISNGYIVKDYVEGTGRLKVDAYGDFSVTPITMDLSYKKINSANYVLPINGNITIDVHNGSDITLNQDIALQPGVVMHIRENASCTLGSGKRIYVYDNDDWGPYVYNDGSRYKALPYVPGGAGTDGREEDAQIIIDGTVDLSAGFAYTTAGGANVRLGECGTGKITMKPGNETKTHQAIQVDTSVTYEEIAITSAKLINVNGTVVETANNKGLVTYESVNNVWTCKHTNSYQENVTQQATCDVAGSKTVTCNCNHVATVEIPKLGHDEVPHEAKAPTCTDTGWDTYVTCSRCDYTTYVEKAALNHDKVAHDAKAPTCTEIGWDAYETCSRCDYSTYAEKTALGHDEITHDAKAPTCTEIGWDAYVTCSRCDYTTYVEKESLGHTEEVLEAKAPTCTATGLAEGKKCTVCGETTVAQTEVPALGHTEEVLEAKAPTCTATGLTEGKHCSVCNAVLVAQETIDAKGHTPDREEPTENDDVVCTVCGTVLEVALGHQHALHLKFVPEVAADCENPGNIAHYICETDNKLFKNGDATEELEAKDIVIAPTGHTAGAEATCTTAQTCTVCGAELVKALGHTAGAEATCTTAQTCTVCGEELKKALGHTAGADATCTEAQTCTVCGEELKKALGHTAGDKATCTTAQTCTVCGAELEAAKGHGEMNKVEGFAATCQKEGKLTHWQCTDCYMNFEDEAATKKMDSVVDPVNPNNHAFAEEGEKTAATCKAEGKIVYPCENEGCEETKTETLSVDPEGHVWDEGTPFGNHSCNSASYLIYKCTLCETENKVVDEEQHFRVSIAEEIPATCTEDGMTSGMKCEKCDEFWIPQEVIPALGHDWNGNLPCQNETSACTRCDLHFDSKQDCKRVEVAGYPATCTEPGLTDGAYCEYCGEVIEAQTEIPVAAHVMIKAEQEVPATCNSVGHYAGASYCMDCDYDENAIPMLEHEWMHREAKKATYSAIGWNAHDYCLLCNATRTLEQYEGAPCEFCGENPEIYTEIPKVEIQSNETLEEFITNIGYLEMMAEQYAKEHPGTDPLGLVLNYLRTAVENYTSGSWAIMAGPEDKDFLKYVQEAEDTINANPDIEVWVNVSGLKKLKSYANTHGEINEYSGNLAKVMTGHFFGTMDMTYHNKGSQNHADVGGWVGDLTDLLSTTDEHGVPANLTLEEKITYIRDKYLFKTNVSGSAGSFGHEDLYADLEGFYFMNELITNGYNTGDLAAMMREYFQPGLTLEQRVAYLLNNRLDGLSTRQDLRTAVYNAYTSNKLIATLEGTRNFNASGNELAELRKAVCYAFADEMCRIAGDYVEDLTNDRFTIFDTETKILAPGISQQINYATNADGKQIVYYVATADVTRDDVGMWVNYYDRDPGTPENPVWKNNSVPSSAQNAQDRYGDPASPDYIENFNVIASTNAGGYDMSDTATPGGLVVMNGVEWYPQTNTAGFFAILADGTAYMGTHDQYEGMMAEGKIKEAIGGFGEFVVKDGKVVGNATYSDAPRTSVGITATGRVVVMCIDGRQAPFSSGASLQDVGYIMKEAGCVIAINLDGGGSTTFVARQPGSDELTVMNRPSDGYPRNVSTNLLIYSTAPSSTKFDHAVIESEYDYATINTPVQMTAAGVSPAGNAVDIPEGATWAVGNEDWASITEDGVFTGKRLGEAYVYLMLDGQVIGSKLMTMTTPDQLYFERAKVDAIYGSSVKLPLRARVGGKAIAINPNDVAFTLSAPTAGSMDGFTFLAAESATKSLSITAAIGEDIKASINVMLYKQGENSFDFDKATGGDRTLAWHREVSNSKLEDSNIYNVIDPAKDMVTSYTFAMDMTTIPIPERISELTYMLPGGTMEGATAWSFLLSLAQRISDMSWVKATIDFDDRFNVDYNNLEIKNEYFEMKALEFDETTNTLSVTMSWIKQSQVIDEATANPLCLINGLKLTPKAGVWEDVSKINAVTSGNISYEIYMRASGLYGFAQKPENQAVFGIYPYRNPADTSDAGGYFRDTYAEITDEYTLVNVVKEGWVNEEGGFAYYVDGERLTGVQKVEDFYYDFGEKGVNVGQTKYSGLYYDEHASVYRYIAIGEITNGWQLINDKVYYFMNDQAVTGNQKVGGVFYDFNEDGSLVSGKWVSTFTGMRYYYGPGYYTKWHEIDGEWYYFHSDGNRAVGIERVALRENSVAYRWHKFTEEGIFEGLLNGIANVDGIPCYFEDGARIEKGLIRIGDDYYYAHGNGELIRNQKFWAYRINCDLPKGNYYFDADGKMIGSREAEIVEIEGKLYYFEKGIGVERGLVKVNGDYYYAHGNGELIVNQKFWASKTSCDLPKGNYNFGPDGKMIIAKDMNGIVELDGKKYYYESGKGVEKGLICIDGEYYYAHGNGELIVNQKFYAYRINCDLPKGNYYFDADGKLVGAGDAQIVTIEGKRYYFEKGIGIEKGLVCIDGEYYYANGNGELIVNQKFYTYKVNCDYAKGNYYFDAEGKLIGSGDNEIVEIDGVWYYFEKGIGVERGLVKVDGKYYYAGGAGELVTNQRFYAWKTNCDLPKANYYFDVDGKMIGSGNGEIAMRDGKLYYFENGVGIERGLVEVDGEYYYAHGVGELIVNQRFYAWKTSCDMPKGNYYFDADGKLIGAGDGEIVDMDGKRYYFEKGIGVERGLIKLDGEYYYAHGAGELIVNQKFWAYRIDCDLPKGNYYFDADGKMIGSRDGEIVDFNGKLHYFEKGVTKEVGLIEVDGEYYYAHGNGELIVDQKFWAYKTNCDIPKGNYYFDTDGKMIGSKNGEIVTIDGEKYYYECGVGVEKGLVFVDGEYYYAYGNGKMIVDQRFYAYRTNCDMPKGNYYFDADGKMIGSGDGEIVKRDGKLYYFEKGIGVRKGLVYIDGYYYYAETNGELIVNQTFWVSNGNGLLAPKNYVFNEYGQIIG